MDFFKKNLKRLIKIISIVLIFYIVAMILYDQFYSSEYTLLKAKPVLQNYCKLPSPLNSRDNEIKILVINGGGINGILPLYILDYLEKKTHQPIHHLFNLIAASSTGAIIAAGLAYPNKNTHTVYSAEKMIQIYKKLGPYALTAPLWYKLLTLWGVMGPKLMGSNLQALLESEFGRNILLNDALTPVMISAYDLHEKKPFFFESWSCQNADPDYYLNEVVMASTAIPGFFPPVQLEETQHHHRTTTFIDGSIAVNNPSIHALEAAMRLYPNKRYLIVNLGTGNSLSAKVWKNVNRWGLLDWLPEVMHIFTYNQDKQTQWDIDFLNSLRVPKNKISVVNIDIHLPKRTSKLNTSRNNMDYLSATAKNYIQEHQVELNRLVDILRNAP